MNFRRFYFIVCSVLSVFMFCIGVLMLVYINVTDVYGSESDTNNQGDGGIVERMLDPFRTTEMNSINVLLLGGEQSGGLTDTMMVVNFNPKTAQINVLSIPRDAQIRLNNRTAKINEIYQNGGGEFATERLSEILQTDIDYYIHVGLPAFREIIDVLGGVVYDVPVDMYYRDPLQNLTINIQAGEQQHFDGEKAEKFMRFRQYRGGRSNEYYDGSDLKRIEAQQSFIEELIRQKANMYYITRINELLDVIFNRVETNLSMSEVLKMTINADEISAQNANFFVLPGRTVEQELSYFIIDRKETMEIVDEHFVIETVEIEEPVEEPVEE
ncbi:LCP family protein [Herbivorax sp. ANBcel31]|uniref:LCP family protein n=1 Tax=Herbivorax sp. ANBcel31 TaxID=3069754 RepID=UPI0027B2FDCF|nr:LCP family protein [Herbivorax sp. ANBcel31]MDQ2085803.1 LCP family protein [Herbivorax sp. ANBcel31]